MKRIFTPLSFISLGFCISISACISPKPIEPESTDIKKKISQTIYATAEMNEINVTKGEDFEITFDSNPSTGFSWALAEDLDEQMIQELDNVYGSNTSDNGENPPLVGSGGTETWTFKALEKGEATIKMKYCQPFDSNNPVEVKTFLVRIQ